jgi:spermidine synthase
MLNGRIIHGYQYTKGNIRRFPTAYYTADSGIGLAMQVFHSRNDAHGKRVPIRAGIVGLGVGVLAAYGTSSDYYRFYEINPNVIRLADEYFTYLRDTAASKEVILGDARLSMERENKRGNKADFDILVLDAFTGDAIPLHLLTRESFNLYFAHLKKDGVLAINISNDHLDLRRLIYGLAQESGRDAIHISNGRKGLDSMPSDWILVSHNKQFLSAPELVKRVNPWPQEVINKPLIFTDDYSNLFRLLR